MSHYLVLLEPTVNLQTQKILRLVKIVRKVQLVMNKEYQITIIISVHLAITV